MISLRARTPKGSIRLDNINPDDSLADLKKLIADQSGIIVERQKIKAGFPPKLIENDNDKKTLRELTIKNGEMLVVEESDEVILSNTSIEDRPQLTPKHYSNIPPAPVASDYTILTAPDAGIMVRRVIPSDNSCLFNAISYCLEGSKYREKPRAKALRQVIADLISSDKLTYDEAYLGQSNNEYCKWIKLDTSWGGAVECSLLSKFYNIQICAYDIQTCRVDRYGQDLENAMVKIYLLYDGIHYDAMALNPMEDGPEEIDITIFPSNDTVADTKAMEYVRAANKRHEFTDTAGFDLRCLVCQKGLKGESEARAHAKQTGHINFGEYKK
jgi:ubiquitin thioesterase OTU1